jgi:hypothetical protein
VDVTELRKRDWICAEGFKEISNFVFNQPWVGPSAPWPKKGLIYAFQQDAIDCLDQMPKDGRYVLMTREYDGQIYEEHTKHLPPSLVKWFAQNVEMGAAGHPLIEAYPHGCITPFEGQGWLSIAYDTFPRKEDNLVLICHGVPPASTTHLHRQYRLEPIDKLKGRPYVTLLMDGDPANYVGADVWYRAVRSHPFVICPPGCGWESNRIWDSLYLGSIPIMKRREPNLYHGKPQEMVTNPHHFHFSDMPIAFVEAWDDITPEWLNSQRDLFQRKSMERTKLSYWINRIKDVPL